MGPFQQIPQLEKLLLRLRNGKGTPQLDRQQPANRLLGYPIFYNQRTEYRSPEPAEISLRPFL